MQTPPPAQSPMVVPSARADRQVWVDHLRTFMIVLVVNMHACCTYGHVGGWYMTEGPDPGLEAKIPFFFWQGHMQAFFMGLLFFLAGHFAFKALARRGGAAFMRERFVRLVLPSFLYMLVLHPFIVAGLNPYGIPKERLLPWLGEYYGRLNFIGSSGPLWFALALFVFCGALVSWNALRPVRMTPTTGTGPTVGVIAAFGAALVLGTFAVRLVQPIGTNILNFQLCFFFQYIAVFIAGVLSASRDWLSVFARTRRAAVIGWIGLIGGPLLLAASFTLLPPEGEPPALVGGWNPSAFAMAFWEQLSGLALGIGCLSLFSRWFNSETRWARWLSDQSFGVYVIHAPVLVGFTLVFAGFQAGPWTKTLLLTLVGLAVSYALSAVARRIPGLGRIL